MLIKYFWKEVTSEHTAKGAVETGVARRKKTSSGGSFRMNLIFSHMLQEVSGI
jgi:hypothetical protein